MDYQDIIYEKKDGIARITINRPEKLNAFRTQTVMELTRALEDVEMDRTVGVVVVSGAGGRAFCVGGDASESSGAGYKPELSAYVRRVHDLLRKVPVPVIAAVRGYAIGGGHVIQVICDLSIASEDAVFGQAGPRVGSFDAGYGASYLARVVGEKKAREIWFLCERYTAGEALQMGLINKVVPADKLDEEVDAWCRKILALGPTALKVLKAAFNTDTDHIAGTEALAKTSLWQYFKSEEAAEGKKAYVEKRKPDFARFRK